YAEQTDDRYKDAVAKEVRRLKKVRKWIADWEQKNEDGEHLDPNDPEYRTFLAENPPVMTGREQRKVDRARIIEEAEQKAEKKADEKMNRMRRDLDEVKIRPEIEKRTKVFRDTVIDDLPENLQEAAKKGTLLDDSPFMGEIVEESLKSIEKAASAFLELENGVIDYDKANPYHNWVADKISDSCAYFAEHGGSNRVQGGKQFLSRVEYSQLLRKNPDAARDKYWTFDQEQILELIRGGFKATLDEKLTKIQEKLDKAGYKLEKKKPGTSPDGRVKEPVTPPDKKNEASPRVGSRPGSIETPPPKKKTFLDKHLMTSQR
ncbi:MAG TPA: hypothetical protein VMW69_02570, partial [Spirochaetia bacterium]|nr:hypothetical protein [Spirochaetia bacterium]